MNIVLYMFLGFAIASVMLMGMLWIGHIFFMWFTEDEGRSLFEIFCDHLEALGRLKIF